jgi:hypothetical protein
MTIARDFEPVALTPCQLRTFEHLRLFAPHYVSRIVDNISFPAPGHQMCRREVHLTLPSLADCTAAEQMGPFIVSLGQFRRRRLADFKVTDGDGKRLNLLSRSQHGYVVALALLRASFDHDEWLRLERHQSLHPSLNSFREYLARLVTNIVPNSSYTAEGAGERLGHLLTALRVDSSRRKVATASFQNRCKEALDTTDYLCWVHAFPGSTVQLHATYTQPESPQSPHDHEPSTTSRGSARRIVDMARQPRTTCRDLRHSAYRRAKMMPLRYVFPTPAFVACRSYYFLLTPAAGTEILLLDWDEGHRYSPDQVSTPLTSTTQIDTASWAYHFHNQRAAQRRQQPDRRESERRVSTADRRRSSRRCADGDPPSGVDRRRRERRIATPFRQLSDRRESRRRGEDRRQRTAGASAYIHAFIRSKQVENGKLVAIGSLGVGLAVLAERGVLQTATNETASQILLLAPAALVLMVDQHNRHHFASLTGFYRTILWLYTIVAVVFAASVVFTVHSLPLISANTTIAVPRVASGLFAVASGLLAFAFSWTGPYFASSNKWRYKWAVKRQHCYGTTSRTKVWLCYRWRPRHWRGSQLLSDNELRGSRDTRKSHEIYAKLARHSADRLAAIAVIAGVAIGGFMLHGNWGRGEACAIARAQDEQAAAYEQRPFIEGKCSNGTYLPGREDGAHVSDSPKRLPPAHAQAADPLGTAMRKHAAPSDGRAGLR